MIPRILLLEAYSPLRRALARTLQRAGWRVIPVHTADEILQLFGEETPTILLMDLDCSTGESWRVLQAFHGLPSAPPVVALISPESTGLQEAAQLGVQEILFKTVRRHELLDRVQNAFQALVE